MCVVVSGCFAATAKMDALPLDYYPRNSPHAAMVQTASETECLIPVAAGVRMRLSLTTRSFDYSTKKSRMHVKTSVKR